MLTEYGLTANQMKTWDVLFFYHVLWPMRYPSMSEIFNDPRVPYFNSMESLTNIYKFSTGIGGSYGHKWKIVDVTELVQFNGLLVSDGFLGGIMALCTNNRILICQCTVKKFLNP